MTRTMLMLLSFLNNFDGLMSSACHARQDRKDDDYFMVKDFQHPPWSETTFGWQLVKRFKVHL